ncbi:MAG: 2-dehydropantoate 2-reductase [bacterium]|nr:2-dehydropantoate 2-reductase [bacterium]
MDFGLFSRKIAVVGIGGVGGFLAGAIGTAYEKELTLVARGDRLKTLKEQGLVLHSELRGEITVHPRAVVCAQELEEQDVIFLCVKNYSLEEACDQIRHAVGEHTIVIPVMNGVDPGDRVRAALGRGIVVDSLIYIVAFIGTDGSIVHQGDFARMRIGIKHATVEEQQAVTLVSDILTGAGVEHLVADDIELEIWRKYILNCAYNVATAAYDNNIGQLRADPQKAKEFEDLVTEAYEVAKAKGVAVLPEHRDEFFDRFHHVYRDDATSSLQRDLNAGKRAEIETFSGYLVREAERLGIAAPVSEKMYGLLKQRALQD